MCSRWVTKIILQYILYILTIYHIQYCIYNVYVCIKSKEREVHIILGQVKEGACRLFNVGEVSRFVSSTRNAKKDHFQPLISRLKTLSPKNFQSFVILVTYNWISFCTTRQGLSLIYTERNLFCFIYFVFFIHR